MAQTWSWAMCVAQGVFSAENTRQIIVLMALKATVHSIYARMHTRTHRPSLPYGWAEPLRFAGHVNLRTFISRSAADALKPQRN